MEERNSTWAKHGTEITYNILSHTIEIPEVYQGQQGIRRTFLADGRLINIWIGIMRSIVRGHKVLFRFR